MPLMLKKKGRSKRKMLPKQRPKKSVPKGTRKRLRTKPRKMQLPRKRKLLKRLQPKRKRPRTMLLKPNQRERKLLMQLRERPLKKKQVGKRKKMLAKRKMVNLRMLSME